jgi:hypothetical protein
MQEHYIIRMSEKKSFVLRMDPGKLKALERWAADEFRSTNGQIEYLLDQALRKSGRWKISESEGSGNDS